jgi:hypothetical protein
VPNEPKPAAPAPQPRPPAAAVQLIMPPYAPLAR